MKKHIVVFAAAGIIGITALLMFITGRRENDTFTELQNLTAGKITDVRFYKDPLRDSEGFDLPLMDSAEIGALADCLRKMTPLSGSVRQLKILELTKIRFTLAAGGESRLVEVSVHRTEKLGERAAVLLCNITVGSMGTTYLPGGIYQSVDFFPWLARIEKMKGFERIKEYRQ